MSETEYIESKNAIKQWKTELRLAKIDYEESLEERELIEVREDEQLKNMIEKLIKLKKDLIDHLISFIIEEERKIAYHDKIIPFKSYGDNGGQ